MVFVVDIHVTPVQKEAYNYYKKNTMSIEIIKDDHLQKINFRVKSKVWSLMVHVYIRTAMLPLTSPYVLCYRLF